jgi:3-oxoacyl-[acyl-carrier-protein] synthase-1
MNVYLNTMGVVCALGQGSAAVREGLFARHAGGVQPSDAWSVGVPMPLGQVPGELPPLDAGTPIEQQGRTSRLLNAALAEIRPQVQAAIHRHGPHRVAVVLGTSTAGVAEGEGAALHRLQHGGWPAGYHYAQQEMGSASAFVARSLGITGPAHAISTACSSSAKAMASAARLLRAGLVDAVVAGGADALCRLTLAGFGALESLSPVRSNPLSVNRRGINIGEGAGLFLMSREPGPVRLAGWGESSDAHHMSAPDPSGRGALAAMQQALQRAGVAPAAVDYVNLHGTATPHNDAMECAAVARLLGLEVPVSSTKPLTGHALAAAGAVEAALCWFTLVDNPQGRLPPHWWDGERDPALPPLHVATPGSTLGRAPRCVLSNSFAFGGSNACLVFANP